MAKTEAAQAKISRYIFPGIGQASKALKPTISTMQQDNIFHYTINGLW